jgi:hypothetical protein
LALAITITPRASRDDLAVEDHSRRRVVVALLIGAGIMCAYWAAWFGDRSLVASETRRAYDEFENAFPAADAWITVCLLAAAWTLRGRRPAALFWLLAGGGAGVYLFCMDVLYDLEHGIWWKSGGGVIEAAINVVTLAYSVWLLRWAWARRAALLADSPRAAAGIDRT